MNVTQHGMSHTDLRYPIPNIKSLFNICTPNIWTALDVWWLELFPEYKCSMKKN